MNTTPIRVPIPATPPGATPARSPRTSARWLWAAMAVLAVAGPLGAQTYSVTEYSLWGGGVVDSVSGSSPVVLDGTVTGGCSLVSNYAASAGTLAIGCSADLSAACNTPSYESTAAVTVTDLVFSYTGTGSPPTPFTLTMNLNVTDAGAVSTIKGYGSMRVRLSLGSAANFVITYPSVPGLYISGPLEGQLDTPKSFTILTGSKVAVSAGLSCPPCLFEAHIRVDTTSGFGPVFNLPPDVTANSAQLGIVDNQWILPANGVENLGNALAGTNGFPALAVDGDLTPLSSGTLTLSNALPNGSAYFIMGASEVNLPLFGGVLVPSLDLIVPGVPIDGTGTAVVPFTWQAGIPSGIVIIGQFWYPDPGGPLGWAASNAVKATAP